MEKPNHLQQNQIKINIRHFNSFNPTQRSQLFRPQCLSMSLSEESESLSESLKWLGKRGQGRPVCLDCVGIGPKQIDII